MEKKIIRKILTVLLCLGLVFGMLDGIPFIRENLSKVSMAKALCAEGIQGNGMGGISININAGYYASYASIPTYGQYAYTKLGCAWFASARVRELTGKGTTIYGGSNWYNKAGPNLGFSRGAGLQAKAIACWTNHVAIVEAISGNTIYISEGGYTVGRQANGYTVIRTVKSSYFTTGGCGTWLGFVYLGIGGAVKPADNVPQGCFDQAICVSNGKIKVRGWAFDRDKLDTTIEVHVYIGDEVHKVIANKQRNGVNAVYPGVGNYHGFEEIIETKKTGKQEVSAYAINIDRDGKLVGSPNPLIGKKSIDIPAVAEPTISPPEYEESDDDLSFEEEEPGIDSNHHLTIQSGESYRITASASTRLSWTGDAVFESAKTNMYMGDYSKIVNRIYSGKSWTSLDKGTIYDVTVKEGSMIFELDKNLSAKKINHDAVVKIRLNRGQSCSFENVMDDSFKVYFNQYNSSIRRRYYKKNGEQSADYIDKKETSAFGNWTAVETGNQYAKRKLVVDCLEGTTVLYLAYEDYINNVISATQEMIQEGGIVYDTFSVSPSKVYLEYGESCQLTCKSNIKGYEPQLFFEPLSNKFTVTEMGNVTAKSTERGTIQIYDRAGCYKYCIINDVIEKNGDITVQTPLRNSITTYQLFRDYPEYLFRSPQEALMERISEECSSVNANRTEAENLWAAWKHMLDDGNAFKMSVKWFSNKLFETTSISDEYLDEVTLELLTEVCSIPEYINDSVKNVKSKYNWISNLKNGIKNSNKAQIILGLSKNSHLKKDEINSIVKELEKEWKNVDSIFKDAGYTIDFFEALTYITIMESIQIEVVNNLLSQVRSIDTTSFLCRGLERICNKINQPEKTVVQKYIKSNIFKKIANELQKGVENGISTLIDYAFEGTGGAGVVAIANIVCTLISKLTPGANADSVIKAQLHTNFFMELSHILFRKNSELIVNKQNNGTLDIDTEILKYKILYNTRLVAAQEASVACQKIAKGYMKNILVNNVELIKSFSYDEHIAGCKAKVNAVLDAAYTYKKSGNELAVSGLVISGAKRLRGNKKTVSIEENISKNEDITDNTKNTLLIFPTMVEGKTVTSISDGAFQGNHNLEVLIIPNGIKEIGENAFKNCTSLKRIYLSNSVTTIGNNAFSGCSSLTYVEFEGSVERIGENAFDKRDTVFISPPNASLQELTKEHSMEVVMAEKEVRNIEVSKCANKLSYKLGEELDETGMEISVTYKDNTKETISNGWCSIGFINSIGEREIKVFYGGKETKYCIEIDKGNVQYDVECIDNGGRQIKFERKEGIYGSKIEISPPVITGYKCLDDNIQLNLDFSISKAVFVYEEILEKSLRMASVTLENNNYKYTGKEIMPKPTVKLDNTVLKENIDYFISYINNKDIGQALLLIHGKGNFDDVTAKEFSITPNNSYESHTPRVKNPGMVTGLFLKRGKKSVIVTWKKVSSAKGYQLQYSLSKKMKNMKTLFYKKTKVKIKKLKRGKIYYFRVRAYKKAGSKMIYGKWSKKKSKKVKK